jgi:hypothetical protein
VQPGPDSGGAGSDITGSTGVDAAGAGTDASTDTAGSSSADTSDIGAGASTGSSDTSGTDAQAPDTGGTPSAAPADAGGASPGGGGNSNSLFGNQPLPAADAMPGAETTLNVWVIVGAALIVLTVVLSHVVSTLRRRGRKRAAPAA